MAARGRVLGATLVALLVVGAYGAAAGWHERIADGYHQARAEQEAVAQSAADADADADRTRHTDASAPIEPWPAPDRFRSPEHAPRRGPAREDDEGDDGNAAEDPDPSEERAEPPAPAPEAEADDDPPATTAATSAPEPEPEPDPTPEPEPEPEPDPAPPRPADDEARLAGLADSLRRDHGLAPLQRSAALDDIARAWARVLADEGALRHNPNVADQVREHYGCCRVAENVVYNAPADVDQAHRQTTESSGHRANLLSGDHERIGIGIVIDDHNRLWGVQVFHGSS